MIMAYSYTRIIAAPSLHGRLNSVLRRGVARAGFVYASLAVLMSAPIAGCIHPNIPSVRHGADGSVPVEPVQTDGFFTPPPENIEEPPEVPWPRFHPLPTRPVLGPLQN
jgi:hypothetical protein